MAYEDQYREAYKAEGVARANGATPSAAYQVFLNTLSQQNRDRLLRQQTKLQQAYRARQAADRLLYEGHMAPTDPEYVSAVAHAEDLTRQAWED